MKKNRPMIWGHLFLGKLRRQLILMGGKDYIEGALDSRDGECEQCGTCCRLPYTCPLLTKDGKCRIYHTGFRPRSCQYFPMNEKDIEDVRKGYAVECGYSFDPQSVEKNSHPEKSNP